MTAHLSLVVLVLLQFSLHNEAHAGLASKSLPKNGTIFINCGGPGGEGVVSDAGFFKGYTNSYATNSTVEVPYKLAKEYKDAMTTHRWAWKGDLEYSIPVSGTYSMTLYFVETWHATAGVGKRKFTVTINGRLGEIMKSKEFDVFKLAKRAYKAFGARCKGLVKSEDGNIRIKLGRVEGMNNPMLSAIMLEPRSSSD